MEKFDLENTEFFKYLRTANGKQGIGIQAYILESFCNGNNIKAKTYIDDGFSGLDLEKPALKKMLNDIENSKHKNKVIIVNDFSRLTRNVSSAQRILSGNVKLYSVTDGEYIKNRELKLMAIKEYYEKPSIEEILGKYRQEDIMILFEKIHIDRNKKIIIPKDKLYTKTERKMIKELKEKWKSPYEVDESRRIQESRKNIKVKSEDEDMEM